MSIEGMQVEITSAVADDQAVAASRPFAASRWLSVALREAREGPAAKTP